MSKVLLKQAVSAIKSGDINQGRELLIKALEENPRDENAWLWMTMTVKDAGQKKWCIENTLAINPANEQAQKGMNKYQQAQSASIAELVSISILPQGEEFGINFEAGTERPVVSRPKSLKKLDDTKQPKTSKSSTKPESIQAGFINFWNSGITGKVAIGCGGLLMLCIVCSLPGVIFQRISPESRTQKVVEQPAVETVILELPTPSLSPTDTPIPTPESTSEPISDLSFSDIVQHPDEKEWTRTQYSTYLDTIKGQVISGWSGTIIEIDEYAGKPYLSLDMKPGEPTIDAYIYIDEEDVLKVGLGQNVVFAGTIDDDWREPNGHYSLQIEDVTLLELGEIPVPTQTPPIPTQEPEPEIPLEVQLYGLEVAEKSNTMGEALQDLGQLLQNPKPGNDDWTVGVALQVTLIRSTHEELLEMDVPTEMTEVHAAVLDATADCNTSMDYLVSGIDNLNTNEIEMASTYMVQCSEKLPKAASLMEEYVTNLSSSEHADTPPTNTLEPELEQAVKFSIITQWQPDENPNGFGADILLEEDLTQEQLIDFVKDLSSDYDPILIRIYTSQQAYDQEQSEEYGDEWREGYVIFYVKNLTGEGAYSGYNEIRWMQEIGEFAHLFGQVTKF